MTEMASQDWKQLAAAARDEEDPKKLMELIEQLNRALADPKKDPCPRPGDAVG